MVTALTMAIVVYGADNTFNYAGKLTDQLIEGASWGMPSGGLPVQITISEGGKVALGDNTVKGPEWKNGCKLDISGLSYSNGELKGTVGFKNSSGLVLEGLRFDVTEATESYKAKDKDGKDIIATRSEPVTEESPILFCDLQPDSSGPATEFQATGLKWNPETTAITVTCRMSGLAFLRALLPEHIDSGLSMDKKGRLLVGSGQQEGIYRFDPASGKTDLLVSVQGTQSAIHVNPTDGTFVARWMNSHSFKVFTAGGEDKATIEEDGSDGKNGWPNQGRFDSKGKMYLCFGDTVSWFEGANAHDPVKSIAGFDLSGPLFDITPDDRLVIASQANVFSVDGNGKNGKKIIQGPDVRIGRTHGVHAIRVDAKGNIWIADETDGEFPGRAQIFDKNGKFITVFGRGAQTAHQDINDFYPGELSTVTYDFAFAPNGRVYLSGSTEATSVYEYVQF